MANFKIGNIKITGMSACVPKNIIVNREHKLIPLDDIEKFIAATGVETRRVADGDTCSSDLALIAAERLISDLAWKKEDIELLVFVSQTGDYKLPVTSALLQSRLGLSKNCIAFDVPLGCSGYIYGLSVISSFMQAASLKKGLLLVGDTISQIVSPTDKSAEPLFGDAATATAVEYDPGSSGMYFSLGTDGKGFEAIIIPSGGSRNPTNEQALVMDEIAPGINRNKCHLILDGMDVFTFGITQAPKNVNELLEYTGLGVNDVDYFVFHQANLFMNEKIRKKLKIESEKVPYSIREFGNTSSATIPLTIVAKLKDNIKNKKLLLCGFGVGLSWGAVILDSGDVFVSDLIEV